MRMHELVLESTICEIRERVRENLAESIADYLATASAASKGLDQAIKTSKLPADEALKASKIDLDFLASVIAGIKVLANKEYRSAMTDDDLGMNPSNMKELFHLLDSVPKDGKNSPKLVTQVFTALKTLAPGIFRKEREKIEKLISKDDDERADLVKELEMFRGKVERMFTQVRSASSKPAVSVAQATAGV